MCVNRTSELKVIGIGISPELPLYNFERLDISWASIILSSKKLCRFVFAECFRVQFCGSRYIMSPNRTSEWNVMTIWISRELPLFNFERLYDLCPQIGHPCEKLWPFEFLENFRCSISSVSVNYAPESHFRVTSYGNLNFSRASVVQFQASRYIMRLNWTSVWQVMTILISREHSLFNYERLDILCVWIGLPCDKLWPFEFLESFPC